MPGGKATETEIAEDSEAIGEEEAVEVMIVDHEMIDQKDASIVANKATLPEIAPNHVRKENSIERAGTEVTETSEEEMIEGIVIGTPANEKRAKVKAEVEAEATTKRRRHREREAKAIDLHS